MNNWGEGSREVINCGGGVRHMNIGEGKGGPVREHGGRGGPGSRRQVDMEVGGTFEGFGSQKHSTITVNSVIIIKA